MDARKLRKLKKQLARLRGRVANLRDTELIKFAGQLGRERSKRGKEPTFISKLLPYSRPITIPGHPGSLKKFTAGNILDSFEQDIQALEELTSNGD